MKFQILLFLALLFVFAVADHDQLSRTFRGNCQMNGGDRACWNACRSEGYHDGECDGPRDSQCWCDFD
uniref:Defensin n=2 Tax=Panagrolaimus sp. JU765 TaxID=591449 RepID=A0AC34RCH5_9BILA